VVVVWYTLFAPEVTPPPPAGTETGQQVAQDGVVTPPAGVAPGQPADVAPVAATDPTATAPRVAIDTPSLSGTISLAGGRIDDLLLKGYHETLDPNSPLVRLLSPTSAGSAAGMPSVPGIPEVSAHKPYYAIYGWVAAQGTDPALVPNAATEWQIESGDVLAPG